MNEQETGLVPVKQDVALSQKFAPQSFRELLTQAKIIVQSGMAPKGMTEAAVVVAVQMGAELDIPPMQSIQTIAVINGRPSLYGDVGLALFKSRSPYKSFEEDAPDIALSEGNGRCKIVMQDGSVIERRFSIDEAKAAGLWKKAGPWTSYPGRMLMWRARWWAMRDADPGVFKGISPAEEMNDLIVIDAEFERPRSIESDDVEKFLNDSSGRPKSKAPDQSSQPTSDIPNPYIGKVSKMSYRKGTTNGKPWKLYLFETDGGPTFSTLSDTVAESVKELGKATTLEIHWAPGKKEGQFELKSADPHIPPKETAEPAEQTSEQNDMFGDS